MTETETRYPEGTMGVVMAAHQASYQVPLVLKRGDAVQVGHRDDRWSMYLWCTGPDGVQGWVPEIYLEKGSVGWRATQAYSTAELSIKPGVRIQIWKEVGGWIWAQEAKGDWGWIPKEKVRFLSNVG